MASSFHVKRALYGQGVFAQQAFTKGDIVFVVPNRYARISYPQLLRKRNTDNPLQISPRRYLDWKAPGVLFNHSCAPNLGLTSYPELAFIALSDIHRGEELTWDYSTSIDKDTMCDFECGCGAKTCRKTIGGFKWLPKRLRAWYTKRGVVQNYLLKEK